MKKAPGINLIKHGLKTAPLIMTALAISLISAPALTAFLPPDHFETSELHSSPVTASTWYETTRGRPLISSWNSEYRPSDFEDWSQDKQNQYLSNQEQVKALLTLTKQTTCHRMPCLVARDMADQLYEKSMDQKHKYERSIHRAEASHRETMITTIALGVMSMIIGSLTGNQGLFMAGITINAIHFSLNSWITDNTITELHEDMSRIESVIASEQSALKAIHQKLEVSGNRAAQARSKILHNMALEHDGQALNSINPDLITLLKSSETMRIKSLNVISQDMLPASFANTLEEKTGDGVFAISFINTIPFINNSARNEAGKSLDMRMIFNVVRHNENYYGILPNKTGDIYFEFSEAAHLLSFFSDLAQMYHSEEATLITLASVLSPD